MIHYGIKRDDFNSTRDILDEYTAREWKWLWHNDSIDKKLCGMASVSGRQCWVFCVDEEPIPGNRHFLRTFVFVELTISQLINEYYKHYLIKFFKINKHINRDFSNNIIFGFSDVEVYI